MKLRARFTLALNALILLVLGTAAVVIILREDQYLIRKAREGQMRDMANFAAGCAAASGTENDAFLLRYAYEVVRSSGLAYAGFYSPRGETIFHSDPASADAAPPPAHIAAALSAPDVTQGFESASPSGPPLQFLAKAVRANGRDLGVGVLAYYRDVLETRRMNALSKSIRRLSWVFIGAVLLSVILAYYLGALLSRPIDVVVRGARAIGAGDLKHRIDLRRPDELGELAEAFDRMAERLQELDRLKEGFIATVTHDLRSPLSSALGYAELMLSGAGGALTPKQEEWMETLKKSTLRLSRMVNNILDAAKLEAGLLVFLPKETPVGELAEEVADSFSPLAQEQEVSLRVRAVETIPAWADPDSIRQVLTNLLSNALKFTPAGGAVTVEVSDASFGGGVHVKVSDSGPDLPAGALESIFSKFSQTRGAGGVELFICKGIIEAQGGKMWAERMKTRGGAFCFTLPPLPDKTPD